MSKEAKLRLQEAIRQVRQRYHDEIAADIQNSTKTYAEIAEQHGVSEQLVFQIARLRGLCRTTTETEEKHE